MGTITEELFRRRLGHAVHAGDTVIAEVDVAMAHDVTGPLAIEAFRSLDLPLWDASRIVFNFDHVMPANTVAAAELHRVIRAFADLEQSSSCRRGCEIGESGEIRTIEH